MKLTLFFGLIYFVLIDGKVIFDEESVVKAEETPVDSLPDKTIEVSDVEISDSEGNEDLVRVPRQYPYYDIQPSAMMVPMPPSARTSLAVKGAYLGEKLPEFLIPFLVSFVGNIPKPLPFLSGHSLLPLLSHLKQPLGHHHSLSPLPGFSPGFLQQLLLSSHGTPPVGRSNEDIHGNSYPYLYSPESYLIPDPYNPYVLYVDPYQAMRSAEQSLYMNYYSPEVGKSGLPHQQSSLDEYQKIKRELEANDLPNLLSETV